MPADLGIEAYFMLRIMETTVLGTGGPDVARKKHIQFIDYYFLVPSSSRQSPLLDSRLIISLCPDFYTTFPLLLRIPHS